MQKVLFYVHVGWHIPHLSQLKFMISHILNLIPWYIFIVLTRYALKQVTCPTHPPSTTSNTSPSPINPNNSTISQLGGLPVHPKGLAVRISSLTNSILELGLPWPPRLTIIGFPTGPESRSRQVLILSKFVSEVSVSLVSFLRAGAGVKIQRRRLNLWKSCDCGKFACNRIFCRLWFCEGENNKDTPSAK